MSAAPALQGSPGGLGALPPAPWACDLSLCFEKWPAAAHHSDRSILCCRAYLAQLNLHRQRIWTCKYTSANGLTYEEALLSEQRVGQVVEQVGRAAEPRIAACLGPTCRRWPPPDFRGLLAAVAGRPLPPWVRRRAAGS